MEDLNKFYADYVNRRVRLDNARVSERLIVGVLEEDAGPHPVALSLGGTGIASEAGEVSDEIKKYIFHGKPLDRDKIIKELGDVRWYYQLLLNLLDATDEEVILTNVEKLDARDAAKEGAFADVTNVVQGPGAKDA